MKTKPGIFSIAFLFRTVTVVVALTLYARLSPSNAADASGPDQPDGSRQPSAAAPAGGDAVQWLDFDPALFNRAARERKLVLLDLEAVWCHWCHVMAERTYVDPAVVKILKNNYLTVRVDQDSRPDLSNKYEQYGWPATIIFDAAGHELVKQAGFIPPEDMRRLLKNALRQPSGGSAAASAAVDDAGAKDKATGASGYIGLLPEQKEILLKKHNDGYDTKNGGWGSYQKFLDFDSAEFAIARGLAGDSQEADRARGALDGELNLVDPAFGGLYQYSTDGDWNHPHFEKVMAIQTSGIKLYCQGYLAYGDKKYLAAARSIAQFLHDFLTAPEGAFYTSQDADLNQGEHSAEYFKLDRSLRLKQGLPRIDKHIYSRENGQAAEALTYLYRSTGEKQYLDNALTAVQWIEKNRTINGAEGGFSHDAVDKAGPYLGDSLAMARAYLALYEVTADRIWLKKAQQTAEFVGRHFIVDSQPGFVTAYARGDVGPGQPAATLAPQALLDENVSLSRFYNLLYRYTGVDSYRESAWRALRFLVSPVVSSQRRIFVAGILLADDENHKIPLHITVVGAKHDQAAANLFLSAIALPVIYKRVEWFDSLEGPLANFEVQLPQVSQAAAFACGEGRCSRPAFDPEQLQKMVQRLTGSAP